MKGLDYSHSRPDLRRVKALGYGFCVRYLFGDGTVASGKGVSKAEAAAIRAAGLGLLVIYESYAGRALEGQTAGVADGKRALAYARAIGFPDNKPIYFAVDIPATAAQQPAIDAYLYGVGSVIYTARVGVYGSLPCFWFCLLVLADLRVVGREGLGPCPPAAILEWSNRGRGLSGSE